MSLTANLAARLAEAVGAKHVVSSPEELVTYAVDGLSPAAIVRPASAAEAVEVAKFAIAEKLKVFPAGSRSKCEIGPPLSRYDIAVDMTALHEIAHYDAGDMTLSIDAGTPLRKVQIFLQEHRQFLPLAVPCFETTTAAGAVASGIDSVLRRQYGTARDFLIGAEFIDGKGQLCKSGGRVVKNVTGYDLHKLLIGSFGTLGIITRLNFRTFPLPALTQGHVAWFSKGAEALEYRTSLEKAGLPLSNLEIIDPQAVKMMRAILQQGQTPAASCLDPGTWCAYSSFEGSEAVVRRISRELEKFARGAGSRNLGLLDAANDEAIGGMLREAFEWLRWGSPVAVLFRLAICGGALEVAGELAQAAESLGVKTALLLRTAGIVYFAVFSENESEIAARIPEMHTAVAALARAQQGSATLLHAPLKVKLALAGASLERAEQNLHLRVKKSFDPSGVFVPGRAMGEV